MVTKPDKNVARLKRHSRVRAKISGTPGCPRLDVFRSAKHIYAQIIDDENGVTLCAASSLDKVSRATAATRKRPRRSAKRLRRKRPTKGISEVVFDRGGYIYHGRVKELAEAAREGGLKF